MRPSVDPSKRPSVVKAPAAAAAARPLADLNILELRDRLTELTTKVAEGDESQETMDAYEKIGEIYMRHPDSQLSDDEARAKLGV